jgi:hypothetical protein
MSDKGTLVALGPEEAVEQAIVAMTSKGASVLSRAGNTVTFTYHKGPNILVLLLLLGLFVVPGIIYGIVAGRDVHFTITAVPEGDGCRLVFGGEYGAGYDAYRRWVKRLPKQ